jgi:hypothetical protein
MSIMDETIYAPFLGGDWGGVLALDLEACWRRRADVR